MCNAPSRSRRNHDDKLWFLRPRRGFEILLLFPPIVPRGFDCDWIIARCHRYGRPFFFPFSVFSASFRATSSSGEGPFASFFFSSSPMLSLTMMSSARSPSPPRLLVSPLVSPRTSRLFPPWLFSLRLAFELLGRLLLLRRRRRRLSQRVRRHDDDDDW